MKINKNVYLKNLVFYLIFLIIICVCLINVKTYFLGNLMMYNDKLNNSNDYTLLNLYFLNTTNEDGLIIKDCGLVDSSDKNSYFISFISKDGTEKLFIKEGSNIYYNNIKLCEDVEEFKVILDKSYKQVINIELKLSDNVYNMQYSLNN